MQFPSSDDRGTLVNFEGNGAQVCSGVLAYFLSIQYLTKDVVQLDVFLVSTDETVFSGSLYKVDPSGGRLQCIAAASHSGAALLLVTINADEGESFRLLVHGYWTFQPALAVAVVATGSACATAVGPIPTNGTIIRSSTTANPVVPEAETLGECRRSVDAGVFYCFVGTGGNMTATTCTNFTSFDTRLSIATGRLCDATTGEECLAWTDDATENEVCSTVSWESLRNGIYKVFVHEGSSGAAGSFRLQINSE